MEKRFLGMMLSILLGGVASAAQPESAMSQGTVSQYVVLNQRLADLKQKKQELKSQLATSKLSAHVYQDCKAVGKKIYNIAKRIVGVSVVIAAAYWYMTFPISRPCFL
jgi:hypothetical protein